MTSQVIMGIDIGKEKFDVAIKIKEKYEDRKFDNKESGFLELSSWLKEKGVEKAWCCMEATGKYGDSLANYLYSKGHKVSVVNPRAIEAFGKSQMRRNKTDKQDARLIEQYCASCKPDEWKPLKEEVKNIQELERHLESLTNQHTQQTNRLECQTNTTVVKSINRIIVSIEAEIEEIKLVIKQEIEKDQELKKNNELLLTIPGIGEKTATIILAELGQIERFSSVKQLDAFVGLSPSQHTSGTSVRKKTQMSKLGNSRLRKALYLPAVSAKNHNPIVKAFCLRLQEKGKVPMCIIGAAMRKLLHLAYGVLKNQLPFDPNFLLQHQLAA
ncbi:MAG: IS110 family transposase [Blastocatellia bacterium]